MNTTVNVRSRIGVMDGFRFAVGLLAFFGAILLVGDLGERVFPLDRDDSDTALKRSGFRIKTDNLTGCQYLMTITGSVQPRMQADGKQVCRTPAVTPGVRE